MAQGRGPVRRCLDVVDAVFGGAERVGACQVHVAEDHHQQVVEVVRHPSSDLAHRVESLRRTQLGLGLDEPLVRAESTDHDAHLACDHGQPIELLPRGRYNPFLAECADSEGAQLHAVQPDGDVDNGSVSHRRDPLRVDSRVGTCIDDHDGVGGLQDLSQHGVACEVHLDHAEVGQSVEGGGSDAGDDLAGIQVLRVGGQPGMVGSGCGVG